MCLFLLAEWPEIHGADDMRASIVKAQDEGLRKLEGDKKKLRDELKANKKELDTSSK